MVAPFYTWERKVVEEVLTFNVEEAEGSSSSSSIIINSYINLIRYIRNNYFPCDVYDPKQQAFLAEIQDSENYISSVKGGEFLDIILQTSLHRTKLRIHLDGFQLVGYQMDNQEKQWLEFGYNHTWKRGLSEQYIPGSAFLDFDYFFSCILREVAEGQTLFNFLLGRPQLVAAVNFLATSMNRQERAWSLIVVKVMICEAVRFVAMSQHLASTFLFIPQFPFPPYLVGAVYTHECNSALGVSGTNRYHSFNYNHWKCQLVRDFDYLFNHRVYGGYVDTAPYTQMPAKQPGKRESLVEVFYVCIDNINGGKSHSGNFNGTIFYKDEYSTQHIYNQVREEDSEFVYSGDKLLLTNMSSCIPEPVLSSGFNFRIFGKNIPSLGTQIELPFGRYNEPLFDEFVTDDFTLLLGSIVLFDAVQATIEATIININGKDGIYDCAADAVVVAHVYGKISARSIKLDDDYEIILFQKT